MEIPTPVPPEPAVESPTMLTRTAEILKSGKFSDVTFLVGCEAVPVLAHSLILAMSSPKFEEILDSKGDTISIPNVEPRPFRQLLQHVYTDKLDLVESSQNAYELYSISKEYGFEKLMSTCTDYLGENLNDDNAICVYEFSKRNNECSLKDRAMEFCCFRAVDILKHDSFLEANIETITELFGQQCINLQSELDLAEALKRVMIGKKLTKDAIRAPIRNIRLLLLDIVQIAGSDALQTILTQIDLLSLMMYKTTENPSIPLTEDLNKSTTTRDQPISS